MERGDVGRGRHRAIEVGRGGFEPGPDAFVHAGDLLDRGSDAGGCVAVIERYATEVVLGNHEVAALFDLDVCPGSERPPGGLCREKRAVFRQVDGWKRLSAWREVPTTHRRRVRGTLEDFSRLPVGPAPPPMPLTNCGLGRGKPGSRLGHHRLLGGLGPLWFRPPPFRTCVPSAANRSSDPPAPGMEDASSRMGLGPSVRAACKLQVAPCRGDPTRKEGGACPVRRMEVSKCSKLVITSVILLVCTLVLLPRRWCGSTGVAASSAGRLEQGQERSERLLREEMARARETAGALSSSARNSRSRQRMGRRSRQTIGLLGTQQKAQLDTFAEQLVVLTAANEQRMVELRRTVDTRLQSLQEENSAKLDQMRQTVDERLTVTLERRLGESFKLVGERLEAVHQGLAR